MKDMSDISEYYEQHSEIVYRYLYRLCMNADIAEELCQETFYQAIRTVDRYRGECKPSVWLCQIARHCWYKYLEKNKRETPSDEGFDAIADGAVPYLDRLTDSEDKMSIYAGMQKLRGEVREVLYLRILGELSFREIGSIMGRTENWARVTYFRGKNELQEALKK